jgi:hypothetical protein
VKELSKEQEKKFSDYFNNIFLKDFRFSASGISAYHEIWQACLEANGLDSPNVVVIDMDKIDWPNPTIPVTGLLIGFTCNDASDAVDIGSIYNAFRFIPRPAPAWKPKDGEAVLFKSIEQNDPVAWVGIVEGENIISRGSVMKLEHAIKNNLVKPYKPGCNARPWSEI